MKENATYELQLNSLKRLRNLEAQLTPQRVSWCDTKQSDGDALVIKEIWGM